MSYDPNGRNTRQDILEEIDRIQKAINRDISKGLQDKLGITVKTPRKQPCSSPQRPPKKDPHEGK